MQFFLNSTSSNSLVSHVATRDTVKNTCKHIKKPSDIQRMRSCDNSLHFVEVMAYIHTHY